MTPPLRQHPWLFALALLMAPACDDASSPPPAPEAPVAEAPAPTATPAPAPTPTPAPPGPAYLATTEGVVTLEAGAFTLLPKSPKAVRHVVAAPGGRLFMASDAGIWTLKDGAFTPISSPPGLSHIAGVALQGPDTLWAVGFGGLASWDGAQWRTVPGMKSAPGADSLRSVAVDGAGKIWLAAETRLFQGDGQRFAPVYLEPDPGEIQLFDDLLAGPGGVLYASHIGGVLRRDGAGQWSALPLTGSGTKGSSMSLRGDGSLVALGLGPKIDIFKDDVVESFEPSDRGVVAYDAEDLSVDGRGRIWMAADQGVIVIDGESAVQWMPGSVPALKGEVTAIHVVAGGPTLPTEVAAITGTFKGRFLRGGAPIAGATVEVCPQASFMFNESPCETQEERHSAQTDAQGRFTLEGVRRHPHSVVIKEGERWTTVLGVSCCMAMTPGGRVDAGDIALKPFSAPKPETNP